MAQLTIELNKITKELPLFNNIAFQGETVKGTEELLIVMKDQSLLIGRMLQKEFDGIRYYYIAIEIDKDYQLLSTEDILYWQYSDKYTIK